MPRTSALRRPLRRAYTSTVTRHASAEVRGRRAREREHDGERERDERAEHERRPPAQEARAHEILEADHRSGHEIRAERVRDRRTGPGCACRWRRRRGRSPGSGRPTRARRAQPSRRPRRCTSAPPRASSPVVRSAEVSQTASSTKKSVCTSNESAYGGVARLGQREHRAEREERQRERRAGGHGRAEAQRPDEREQHADRRARRRPA